GGWSFPPARQEPSILHKWRPRVREKHGRQRRRSRNRAPRIRAPRRVSSANRVSRKTACGRRSCRDWQRSVRKSRTECLRPSALLAHSPRQIPAVDEEWRRRDERSLVRREEQYCVGNLAWAADAPEKMKRRLIGVELLLRHADLRHVALGCRGTDRARADAV